MARVGKSVERQADSHDRLLAAISDHASAVYERLEFCHVDDPKPRDFALIGLALKAIRELNGLAELPRDVVTGTFLWLIPVHER